ncbi:hypothetical protein LTR37_018131 [Vermiconidia calcicola]|uniref:Uncharacterized protein n=1 Tax=Vermiconidia calcicola TaxID=1690605 RepID=A0ACC3MJN0_9PEZI|nr:hypothetical protein LTR37_018131 [Vermiconidia calcicola]
MFSSSRTWVAPKVKEISKRHALNQERRKVCRNSPFWCNDFDVQQHKREWEAGRVRMARDKMVRNLTAMEESQRLREWEAAGLQLPEGISVEQRMADMSMEANVAAEKAPEQIGWLSGLAPQFPLPPPPIRRAFDDKIFDTNHSNVLSHRTVFCPQSDKGRENVAPWPSRSEMKYEGDDRISTDRLHGRFPGVPRVEGNDTVNWQHKATIEQYPFDDFYYPIPQAFEIIDRTHFVAELEFTDQEGEQILGKELMGLLDPQDQW